jgi:hypothetical protein
LPENKPYCGLKPLLIKINKFEVVPKVFNTLGRIQVNRNIGKNKLGREGGSYGDPPSSLL